MKIFSKIFSQKDLGLWTWCAENTCEYIGAGLYMSLFIFVSTMQLVVIVLVAE